MAISEEILDLTYGMGFESSWIDIDKKRFYAIASYGESKNIQFPNSDANLYIPEGSEGYFLLRTLTDDKIYRDFDNIPDDECFVSAVVEVKYIPLNSGSPQNRDLLHTLKIAHCLPEEDLWKQFIVRQWSGKWYRELQSLDIPIAFEGCFYVDKQFITIHTNTFSTFTCTISGNICQFKSQTFLCGKMNYSKEENETTLEMKSYFCTYLNSLKEFRKVCTSIFFNYAVHWSANYH